MATGIPAAFNGLMSGAFPALSTRATSGWSLMIARAVLKEVWLKVSAIRWRIAGRLTSRMPSYSVMVCPGFRQ